VPIFEPQITWKGNIPFSDFAKDIYFSPENGMEETTHVFIKGNNLVERWQAFFDEKIENNKDHFTILETGFGTGLNFAVACYYFLNLNSKNFALHFVSIEKYPLSKSQIERALLHFPELHDISIELLRVYPLRICGIHRLSLFNGKVTLTLFFDDIATALDQLNIPCGVNAFFLDGFNPALNPDMWSENVIKKILSFAAESSTLATFTAAGFVRRNIISAGFEVFKTPGYGKKREMITARVKTKPGKKCPKPWFNTDDIVHNKKEIVVIGSGLAGCSLAASFIKRGWRVTVIDDTDDICSGASGNPLGIFFPVVHKKPTFTDRLSRAAYLYTLALLNSLPDSVIVKVRSGLIQLLNEHDADMRFGDYLNSHGSIEKFFNPANSPFLSSLESRKTEIFFPEAGFISPRDFSLSNIEAAKKQNGSGSVEFIHGIKVQSIVKNRDGFWEILDKNNQLVLKSEVVVLANSFGVTSLEQTNWLPISKIRGQLVFTKKVLPGINCPVSGEVYIIPSKDGTIVGATHDFSDDERISQEQGRGLLEKTTSIFSSDSEPAVFFKKSIEEIKCETAVNLFQSAGWKDPFEGWAARVAFRSAATDHFPVIGQVPVRERYLEIFKDLSHGPLNYFRKNGPDCKSEAWHNNLYCMTGLGSRGIIYSQLGAEIIASMVCNEPSPVENDLVEALSPARFLYRSLKTSHRNDSKR
jgi:tRNA 5-methylaminomethyl-2-thiouridine biosynthesis bifunctional protein